jgi:hypothetical protein
MFYWGRRAAEAKTLRPEPRRRLTDCLADAPDAAATPRTPHRRLTHRFKATKTPHRPALL